MRRLGRRGEGSIPSVLTKFKAVMIKYKDILVAKGSALYDAIHSKDSKAAEKIYKETTDRYCKLHSAEDRAWFAEQSKK